ncbi:MAG: hypothetical protein P1V20_31750 [Verrucomicrobiales bacterium]|nr:hypothetical protein [Verrucomicrobiales bacterium]
MRYTDDLIVGFKSQVEAEDYLKRLTERLGKFNLRLAEEKSGQVRFQHWRPNDSGKFTFLGFDFYWAKTRRNKNHRVVKSCGPHAEPTRRKTNNRYKS